MFNLKLITPNGKSSQFQVKLLNVVSTDGQRGIISNRAPIVMMLDISKIEIVLENQRLNYFINGGCLYFEENECLCLVNNFESAQEIDLNRAIKAKERAEKRLAEKQENIDLLRAEIALKKANTRISIVQQ